MTTTPAKNRPSHEAYVVEGNRQNAIWTKIGAAWPHDDGTGFTVKLTAIPLSGRLVLRVPKAKDAAQPEGEAGA